MNKEGEFQFSGKSPIKHNSFLRSFGLKLERKTDASEQIKRARAQNIFQQITDTIKDGKVMNLQNFGFKNTPYYKEFMVR